MTMLQNVLTTSVSILHNYFDGLKKLCKQNRFFFVQVHSIAKQMYLIRNKNNKFIYFNHEKLAILCGRLRNKVNKVLQ